MKSYDECCKEVGYARKLPNDAPPIVKEYFGYEGGKVFPCKTRAEAEKYKIRDSRNTPESEGAHKTYWAMRCELERSAADLFQKTLRVEYSNLSDKLYELCYSEAYERGHSAGLDEVASHMCDIVDFVENVRAC